MSVALLHNWHYSVSKLLYATPVYRYTLISRTPRDLTLVPPDAWPGSADCGAAIVNGEFSFIGQTVRGGLRAWRPGGMSEAWLAELHGFDWLRDLRALGGDSARRQARDLVGDWLVRQSNWHEVAWRPDVLGSRLFAWLGQHDFFCASAEDAYRQNYLASLARQAKHLSRVLPRGTDGAGLILAAKGLVAAGLSLPGHDAWIAQGLRLLERACAQQILADGGHISRNPAIQTQVLRHLVDTRSTLLAAQREVPAFLMAAIDRTAPFLRMLRHNDGGLALFNGGNEGHGWLIDMLLAQADSRGRPLTSAPHSGFERIVANRTIVLMDTGVPAPGQADASAHASTLAIEISIGRERIIVNCGARPGAREPWTQVQRSTAAHSTMIVDDTNSSDVLATSKAGRRPGNVAIDRNDENGNIWLSASHDGYGPLFGVTHQRRLYIDASGEDIRGEDSMVLEGDGKRPPRGYALRFHLHPSVQASLVQNGSAVLLRPPSGVGWRLVAEGGTVSLAESVYLGGNDEIRRSEQIVVSGVFDPPDGDGAIARVKWALKKVPKKT
ncbi:MAG: heparinase II/III family protein [Alphaproteobacteria bacterium]|nr:heparinase II/III family protein [Alphaproteobacteria bacterium]MCZ6845058.1 heparinase II/III family protein [Alphaproteobacteria bacterium]